MAATTYTWNTIVTGQTDGDSPLDETLMEGFRQNLISLEEWLGDGFAQVKDHDHDNVNSKTVVLGDGVVTNPKMYDHAAGTLLYHSHDAEVSDSSSSGFVKKKEILLTRGGIYRVKFDVKVSVADTAQARIYRNGVGVGTVQNVINTAYDTRSKDIVGWSAGDTLELRLNDSTATIYARNLQLYVAVPEVPYNTV